LLTLSQLYGEDEPKDMAQIGWFAVWSRQPSLLEPGRSSVDSAGVGLLKFIQLSYSLSRFFSSDPDQRRQGILANKGL
jgi:hypothetical protein